MRLSRAGFGAIAGLFLISWAFFGCHGDTVDPASRPDILIICIDALRADHLGCYGYVRDTSPNIDALSERSLVFEAAWSASSWTKSSVPSIFTGLLPSEHGVFEGSHRDTKDRITSDVLGRDFETLAEALKKRGYRAGAFIENAQLRAFLGFDQGFDVYEEDVGDAEAIVDGYLEWYSERNGTPSFAYLHILDPHWPYLPRPPFDTRFGVTPSEMDFATKRYRALRDGINSGEIVPTRNDLDRMVELYDGLIAQVDHALGRLFKALERLDPPPVIVVTADHGEEFYEDGRIGHGHSLSERQLHVPLILFDPGQSPGRRTEPCSLIDLYPTLCARAGAVPPDHIHGRDLLDPDPPPKSYFVAAERRHSNQHLIAWREGDLKLVRSYKALHTKAGEEDDRFTSGLRVEVSLDEELLDDASSWRAEKIKIKEDQSEKGLEVQGLLEALDAEGAIVRVLGIEGRLRSDVAISGTDGSGIPLSDFHAGLPVEIDGSFDEEGVFRVKKLKRIDPDAFSPELEGIIEEVEGKGSEWHIVLGGRTVIVDRDSRFKDEREIEESEEDIPVSEDALRPARLLSREGLEMEEHLYDLSRDSDETSDLAVDRKGEMAPLVRSLEQWLARADRWVKMRKSEHVELDDETIENLREIGYLR